ncbi:MAG: MFS transporter [Gammaproteobacteria bacterium]|nr:MFS transporter [Gammaproteobacteria bacterium]|tara:strand:+ start:14744 stop:16168 length:1425 start_codon:yes stop_codon:yes gene_type:complete
MTLFEDKPGDDGLPGSARMYAMFATMVTTTINVLDGSMINIALPQMATTFNAKASDVVWVANSYLLAVSMSIAFFSALATRIGFRKQFMSGLALFSLASLGCALSNSLEQLIFMRFIQGIGSAATMSIAPAIIKSIFPGRLLGRILGINALLVATCTAVAPIMSGSILVTLDWSWLFLINLPLGLLAITLAYKFLPQQKELDTRPLDKSGAVLSVLTLASTILCANVFSQDSDKINTQSILIYACVAVISGMLFIKRQKRATAPLLPLEIFANTRFTLSALTSFISFVAHTITFIALPFLYEFVFNFSPLKSALMFLPWPIGIILVAPHAGRLADKYNPPIISTLGLFVFGTGIVLLNTLPDNPSDIDILWRSFVCGAGFGIFQSPNNREIMSNVKAHYSSYASGVLAIMRTFGQSLGSVLIGVMLAYAYRNNIDDIQSASYAGIEMGLWIAAASVGVAVVLSGSRLKWKSTQA